MRGYFEELYALVEDGVVVEVGAQQEGWLPIIDNPPADSEFDWTNRVIVNSLDQWPVSDAYVTAVYDIVDKTAAEILDYMQRKGWMGKLSVDTTTIPADSTTAATVTYTAIDPVTFIVDGESIEKIPNDVYTATLTVAADAPGFIEVRIPGVERVVTITVTEVEA